VLEEMQRALGRIEGSQKQILQQMHDLRRDFNDHKGDDRQNFQVVSSRFGEVARNIEAAKNDFAEKLEAQDEKRSAAFTNVESQLQTINGYVQNIKGAWWMVVLMATFMTGIAGFVAWVLGYLHWPRGS